jgi:hypothetical protein
LPHLAAVRPPSPGLERLKKRSPPELRYLTQSLTHNALVHTYSRTFYVCNPTSRIPDATGPYTEEGTYAPFDRSKPSIVFITAGCRTLTSLQGQFEDTRLRNNYNLIAVAGKYHDRTHKVVDGKLIREDEVWTLTKGADGIQEALVSTQRPPRLLGSPARTGS